MIQVTLSGLEPQLKQKTKSWRLVNMCNPEEHSLAHEIDCGTVDPLEENI